VLSPCICVLLLQWILLFQSSSLLPSPLPMVALAILNFRIHSCTVSTSTSFKFLVSFPYPIPPMCSLSLVWPVSHNITAFVLGLHSIYEGEHAAFWPSEPG
jgi:hypothetical protein